MEELTVGDQTIRFDRDATIAVYASIETSGLQACGCLYCRNFAAQRDSVYPSSFLELLQRLGVDPAKETEAFEYGPISDWRHIYGGWFHLVGELLVPGERFATAQEAPEFSWWFRLGAPRDERFSPQISVEFIKTIPWVLPECLE